MLKKTVVIFLYIFFITTAYGAEHDAFERANILYDAHDFKGALEAYATINDKGYAVWYNMGNAYFELQDYARALVHWKRAERQASSIGELRAVKDHIRQAYDKLGMVYENNRAYAFFQYIDVALPFLVTQIFFIFLMCVLLFFGKTIIHNYFGIFFIVGFAWVLLSILVLVHYEQQTLRGYIVTENAQLRNGPNVQRQPGVHLKRGAEVGIQHKRVDWYKITSGDSVGWVPVSDVEVI